MTTLDATLATLTQHKDEWATLPIRRKIDYLELLRDKTDKVAERWVTAAAKAKKIPADSPLVGEEWISGPWALIKGLNVLIRSLDALNHGTTTYDPDAVRERADGQVVVDVFPSNFFDRLVLSGFSAEVWMQPGVTRENLAENTASFYRNPAPEGKVALVLGAGNIASIAPLDVLYKMFADGTVCVLKMNPVNDYLGPFFEEIFVPLVSAGYLGFAYGGADVGGELVAHEAVDEIHVTGDYRTYNAIVFGMGEDGERRRVADTPVMTKPVTAELGNVSATIVVPGPWTDDDIQFQAEHIVTQKSHNAGFNCIATQVLVLPAQWEKTDELTSAVRSTMKKTPPREPYYPGADRRQSGALSAHPEAELIDSSSSVALPRMLITGLDSQDDSEYCFNNEFFSNVLSVTSLPGNSAVEYLENAVAFANEKLWGTLGITLLIHPRTIKELGTALDDAVARLKFGCIGINAWIGAGFLFAETPWGAFPGHARNDIRSGTGVAHNGLLFDKPQKSVVRQPFYPFPRNLLHGEMHLSPKPAWFVTHRREHDVGRRFTRFEARPGLRHLPGLFLAALRG
ncbi:MAG TPA: aldehyde dehydrogenase family protein [Gemmatimonadaceae bacterium]|nr:aldehyde dehydrogenase family protein [Gemmatimonadaceae bacterium]